MKDVELSEIKAKVEELEEIVDNERMEPRFDSHYFEALQHSKAAIEFTEDYLDEKADKETKDTLDAYLKTCDILVDALLKKFKETSEDEEVLEALGKDYFRKIGELNVRFPLVVTNDFNEEDFLGRGEGIIQLKKKEEGFEFSKNSNQPVIMMKDKLEVPYLWGIAVHEFSHVAYPSDKHLNDPGFPNHHTAEFFSDMMASKVLGPVYLDSLIEKFGECEEANKTGEAHPAESSRVTVALDILDEMDIDTDLEESVKQRVEQWRQENNASKVVTRDDTTPKNTAQEEFRDKIEDLKDFVEISDFDDGSDKSGLQLLIEVFSSKYEEESVDYEKAEKEILDWYPRRD